MSQSPLSKLMLAQFKKPVVESVPEGTIDNMKPSTGDVGEAPAKGLDFAALMKAATRDAESIRLAHEAQLRDDAAQQAAMDDDYSAQYIAPKSREVALFDSEVHEHFEENEPNFTPDSDEAGWDDYNGYDDSDKYDDIMEGINFPPDPSQAHAVRELAHEQYGCLIGAAGTGKTFTTRLLLNALINGDAAWDIEPMRLSRVNLRAYHSSTNEAGEDGEAAKDIIPAIAMCAYTGQATQVIRKAMPGSWQKNVFTIHSLLGFFPEVYTKADGKDGMRFVPYYTKLNKMPWNVIIVDEASMVSVDLWHMLLDAAPAGCRFYFIGDLNQLPPPIGQGILGFALTKWKVCELTHVHRQSDDEANKIIDTAHAILKGKMIEFDDPTTNPNWRVIGMSLPHSAAEAYEKIVGLAKGLSGKTMPNGDRVYDPWRDRIMTTMNGFDENTTSSLVGQHPINDALSQVFADPNEPRIVIDAKREQKRFAVGYRVMATKNESPAEVNRVTNGLTGKIVGIEENAKWLGDRRLVGDEIKVTEARRLLLKEAMAHRQMSALDRAAEASHALDTFAMVTGGESKPSDETERNGGPASHVVTVKYDNGATRNYSMNAQIEQLRIAYASTTHKAQGAEFPTAIVVVHHASRQMLCRENLYTAVTRASKRVIVLYSPFGLQIALATQKISGKTLKEKLKQYERLLGEGDGGGFKIMNVRLSEHDR